MEFFGDGKIWEKSGMYQEPEKRWAKNTEIVSDRYYQKKY